MKIRMQALDLTNSNGTNDLFTQEANDYEIMKSRM